MAVLQIEIPPGGEWLSKSVNKGTVRGPTAEKLVEQAIAEVQKKFPAKQAENKTKNLFE